LVCDFVRDVGVYGGVLTEIFQDLCLDIGVSLFRCRIGIAFA